MWRHLGVQQPHSVNSGRRTSHPTSMQATQGRSRLRTGYAARPYAANGGQPGGLAPDQRAALQRLRVLPTSSSSQLLRICALTLADALLAVLTDAGVRGAALMAYMWREGPKLWERLGTDGCTRMSSLSNGLWTLQRHQEGRGSAWLGGGCRGRGEGLARGWCCCLGVATALLQLQAQLLERRG